MSVDPASERQRDLTVARVRECPGMDFVEVMFLESARIFRVSRSHEHFDRLVSALQASEAAGRLVRITLTTPHGDDIADTQIL